MEKKYAPEPGHRELVVEALENWKRAMRYYESVNDPALIEFAIYEMEAAKRKYVFLLKKGDRK